MKIDTNPDGSATVTMPESGAVMIRAVVAPSLPPEPKVLRDARGRYRRRRIEDNLRIVTAEECGEPVWTMEAL